MDFSFDVCFPAYDYFPLEKMCELWWEWHIVKGNVAHIWKQYQSVTKNVMKFKTKVTGPPGALLFDRDQRSHWNNHYNCCFIWVAALGIYCTDFLPQLLAQVKYPMQFGWASYLTVVTSTLNRQFDGKLNTDLTAFSEEICLHWATMHWTTGIRNNKILWLWLGMTHVITSQ